MKITKKKNKNKILFKQNDFLIGSKNLQNLSKKHRTNYDGNGYLPLIYTLHHHLHHHHRSQILIMWTPFTPRYQNPFY